MLCEQGRTGIKDVDGKLKGTGQLSAYVFAYAKYRFSYVTAYICQD